MAARVKETLEQMLKDAGVTGVIEFSSPPNPSMGDLAFGCFSLAKEKDAKPGDVAQELASQIINHKSQIINDVKAFGPYVNFFLNAGVVAEMVIGEIEERGSEYGWSNEGAGQKVMIEYPSNNTHKEFHIGHFRNVCIGNPLTALYRSQGYEARAVNYLNDFGAHVPKCLWGLLKFHKDEAPPENKQRWLGEIYAEANNYIAEHPEAKVELDEFQKKFEAREGDIWPLYVETRSWSIEQFDRLFKELGVEHEGVFYEKDIREFGQNKVDELLKKGIAKVGEGGAIIADLSASGLDIALLRKSNGVGLYITADLALAEEKFKRFDADESVVVTALEQNFYFRQLFKILELMGFKKKMTHIGYGLVTRPDGKMSSRLGNVILYEDLRDEVYAKFYAETKERHLEWSEEKLVATSLKLTLAALKFDIQKHEAAKNIVFDIKEATSFEGFSAPYVLYAVARINSIVRKAEAGELAGKIQWDVLATPEEKRLALMMGDYGEVIRKALAQYNPSVIARYCFDLAQAFNDFYNKHSILNAQGSSLVRARLALAEAVAQVLKNALGLLTIETVEEM